MHPYPRVSPPPQLRINSPMKSSHAIPRCPIAVAFCLLVTALGTLVFGAQPEAKPTAPESKPAAAVPADQPSQRWAIGVVADNRGGTGTHGAILKHFQTADVELILNLGDMVYPAPGGEWEGIVRQFRGVFGEKAGDEFLARRVLVTAGGWDERYMNQAQKLTDRGQAEATRPKRSRPGYEPDNAAGHSYKFAPDPRTLKLMVPGAFSDSSDGYFLIHITPSNGLIELDHFRFTRELKHQHRKTAGEPLPPPSKK